MMKPPTVLRFLGGALLGSLVGALMWMFAFGADVTSPATWAVACFLIAPVMFLIFVAVGMPLFFLTRRKKWAHLWVALPTGALCGIAATILFGGPDESWATAVFGIIGTVAALISWLFVSSNYVFQRTPAVAGSLADARRR